MDFSQKTVIVPTAYDGSRLDKALELLAPEQGARQRRRLFLFYAVRVDGRPRHKGYLVRAGQHISLEPASLPSGASVAGALPVVVARTRDFAALLKAGRTHSESVGSSSEQGLDACLPQLFPDVRALLLNRLDYLTSGVLLVGFSESAQQVYLRRQEAGEVFKHYFALVHGRLEAAFVASNALDTARRRKVKVLRTAAPPIRQSVVQPLACVRVASPEAEAWRTLVRVRIQKGARHQIRAHLSASGHPIVGDPLYGPDCGAPVLYLHHFAVRFPEFQADARPDWPELPVVMRETIQNFSIA